MKHLHHRSSVLGYWVVVVGLLAGCQTTMQVVRRERIDQAVTGNQGYLQGVAPASAVVSDAPKTRRYLAMDVDLTDPKLAQAQSRAQTTPTTRAAIEPLEPTILPEPVIDLAPALPSEPISSLPTSYVVQAGDTLSKIAARPEIYGNGRKWHRLYEANKDRVRTPNVIQPGTVLVIPRD